MKLLASFLPVLPSILGQSLSQNGKSIDFDWDGLRDDAAGKMPVFGDRVVNDGGSCPETVSRDDAYDSMSHVLYDFRTATRVELSDGPVQLETEAHKSFWWKANRFTKIEVKGYGKAIVLSNNLHPDNPRTHHIWGMKYNFDGGAFYCQITKDRSQMKWFYGSGKKGRGFVPHTGYVFTFLYLSNSEDGCPDDVGATYQVLLLIDLKQRTRIVFNYGDLKLPHKSDTRVGFGHKKGATWVSKSYLPEADGEDGDDNIQDLEYYSIRYKNMDQIVEKSPISADPELPITCTNIEHCSCPPILEADNLYWENPNTGSNFEMSDPNFDLDVKTHYEFSGHCSETPSTRNYGEYYERGHVCFVKPKSDECTKDGLLDRVFTDVTFMGSPEDQHVSVYSFACVIGADDFESDPYWQRIVSRPEKKLKKEVYRLSINRRAAQRKKWKAARAFRVANGGSRSIKPKWEKQQDRAENRAHAAARQIASRTISVPKADHEMHCGFDCVHPSVWSAANIDIGGYEDSDFSPGASTWACVDAAGDAVTDGADVPYGGWCEMTCGGSPVAPKLKCDRWWRPTGHFQYFGLHDLIHVLLGDEGYEVAGGANPREGLGPITCA